MKKIILKSLACLLFIAFVASCSSEESIVPENTHKSAARSSVWDGVIGLYKGGTYQITADVELIRADMEAAIEEVDSVKVNIDRIEIVKKFATNSSTTIGYMLIGSSNSGVSVGSLLMVKGNGFYLDPSMGTGGSAVVCRGCSSGCFLEFLLVEGKKFPYCNEFGCGVYCEKKEYKY